MLHASNECKIFVISLEHAQERRKTIAARLNQLDLIFEFLPGVDGRKLHPLQHPHYEPLRRRLFWGRDLSNGEFGCVLAHRGVYQHMVEHQIPLAVVLEDDAILTNELPTVVSALSWIADQWDLVRFLGREKNYKFSRIIGPLAGTSASLSRPHGVPGGAYGYLLNLKAARRLLEMMDKNWLAIDTLHGVSWLTDLKTLSVVPSPVLPNDDIPSCIDEQDSSQRWDKRNQLQGWMKISYPVTRFVWKTYLSVWNTCLRVHTWRVDRQLGRALRNSSSKE